MDKCIYCSSTDLTRNIKLGLNAEHNSFGLKHNALIGITGVEPVHADLCNSCGSITRFHISEIKHKWVIEK